MGGDWITVTGGNTVAFTSKTSSLTAITTDPSSTQTNGNSNYLGVGQTYTVVISCTYAADVGTVPVAVTSNVVTVTIKPATTKPAKQGTAPSVTVPVYTGTTATTKSYPMGTFFTAGSIKEAQQICSVTGADAAAIEKGPNGVTPITISNSNTLKGSRDVWSVTLTNNQQKTVTFKWAVTCNGVVSDSFSTAFTFTPVALTVASTTAAALTGTYYSTAQANILVAASSTWFTNMSTNTGVVCTLTLVKESGSNIVKNSDNTISLVNTPTAYTSTGNTLSCVSDQQTTAQVETFGVTWTGCAVATRNAAITAAGATTYSFQGTKGQSTIKVDDLTKVFFVNTDCPTSATLQGRKKKNDVQPLGAAATTSNCDTSKISSTSINFID